MPKKKIQEGEGERTGKGRAEGVGKSRRLDTNNVPLHVTALGTTKGEDALLCKHGEGNWVNALLVDDNKRFVRAVADLLFQSNNLLDTVINKRALGGNHLLAIRSRLVEKARVDLADGFGIQKEKERERERKRKRKRKRKGERESARAPG